MHLMCGVFALHDRKYFEVFGYALRPTDGSLFSEKVIRSVDHFSDLSSLSIVETTERIRSDGIHILVNLNGWTLHSRNEIFHLRSAPIQVLLGLAFPGTMGTPAIDFLISDEIATPPHMSNFFSERLVFMPTSYFVADYPHLWGNILGNSLTRKDYFGKYPNIRAEELEDKILLANFSQLNRIDRETFHMWLRILLRVPHAVLWLLRHPPLGETNLRAEARSLGIPDAQLIFTDPTHKAVHLQRCSLADLILDTPVRNGHTVTADVLWMGVPLVTIAGDKLANRAATSLLTAGIEGSQWNLSDWVFPDMESCEEGVVDLCTSKRDKLVAFRKYLLTEGRQSSLWDTSRWTSHLETFFLHSHSKVSKEPIRISNLTEVKRFEK